MGLSGGRLFCMSFSAAISTAFAQTIEECDGGSMGSGSRGSSVACASLLAGEILDVPVIGGAELWVAVGTDNT